MQATEDLRKQVEEQGHIVRELKAGNLNKAKRFGLMDCIECGCCAFVCPAHINIVQRVRLGKGLMRQKMAEAKAKEAK